MKKYYLILSALAIFTIFQSCEKLEGPFYSLEGCTDTIAFNYNADATDEDNSCCYIAGCTNPIALNYDSLACWNIEDSCIFENGVIAGCTDLLASNYNPEANEDDGSCIAYVKNVLIEDFTGHTCPNCPDAAIELEAIHSLYGDQIIGMAIHVSNSFARPYPESQAPSFQYDFRTQWGDDWDASNAFAISVSGLPRGMVNRTGYPDNHKLGKNEWLARVDEELIKPADFGINIESNSTDITIKTKALTEISGSYNLVVCLTESYIINWQKDGQESIEDYEHNHILRTVLIDELLSSSNTLSAGETIEKNIPYNLSSLEEYNINYSMNTAFMGNGNAGGWDAENISIVAYIYNTDNKEILQVNEVHLND